jgi:hypothetical protein
MTRRSGRATHLRNWNAFSFSAFARLYARARVRRLNRLNAEQAQRTLLRQLLRRAHRTRFGQANDFDLIDDVTAYQRQVPVREYDAFWLEWWKKDYPDLVDETWPGRIPYFSMTSGTSTGRSKYIPYTTDMRRAAVRGFVDLLCHHLVMRPESRVFDGDALGLTGPTDLNRAAPGVDIGAVSAITVGGLPDWLSRRVLPTPEIARIDDWQKKIARLAPLSLDRDIRFLGGSPNWLLIFLDEVARCAEGKTDELAAWYPNLELIVHGGVNFAPYRQRFKYLMANGHAETREMYSASEGVFAYADRGDGEGMRLHLDGQVFFEFIPADQVEQAHPERFWVGNFDKNVDYAMVVTTAAGLWSYLVGDLVRFVDLSPPRLIVVGRVQKTMSVFGEHLIENEIADAMAEATSGLPLSVVDYCMGSVAETGRNHHLYLVETTKNPDRAEEKKLAKIIDDYLSARNEDYSELRKGGLALSAPVVRLVAPGQFMRWMKSRRGLGGQFKVPRIVTDKELFDDICTTVLDDRAQADGHAN